MNCKYQAAVSVFSWNFCSGLQKIFQRLKFSIDLSKYSADQEYDSNSASNIGKLFQTENLLEWWRILGLLLFEVLPNLKLYILVYLAIFWDFPWIRAFTITKHLNCPTGTIKSKTFRIRKHISRFPADLERRADEAVHLLKNLQNIWKLCFYSYFIELL